MALKLIILAFICCQLAVDCYADEIVKNKKPFSIDDVALYGRRPTQFNGTWISSEEIVYRKHDALHIFNAVTQKIEKLVQDPDILDLDIFPSADGKFVLVQNYVKNVNSYVSVSNYSICQLIDNRCKGGLKELVEGQLLPAVLWAPKGSALAYVRDNDIYYQRFDEDSSEVRRITTNGVVEEIFNGITDWAYGDEIYPWDHTLMRFSPSGQYLAFITLNDTNVGQVEISRYNTPGSIHNQYPEVVTYKYPKVGTPIPEVTLNLVDLESDESSPINLHPPAGVGSQPLLYAVGWLDNETIVSTWTNREQNYSQIVTHSLDGRLNVLLTQESSEGWQVDDIIREPPILSNDYLVLVELQSIADNPDVGSFPHVIRYNFADGKLSRRLDLTPEATWVTKILGIDESRHLIYYTANPPNEPSQQHLYSVDLHVPEPKCLSCAMKTREGNACKFVSEASFSKDFSHYAITCIGPDPASIVIYKADHHTQTYEWFADEELLQFLNERMLPKLLDLEVPANGFNAKVRLSLPVDFEPTKKYPMLVFVYGGPNVQLVTDKFSAGFDKYMTTKRQVIYAVIDGRGTGSKGTAMMYAVYRKLGSAEIEDQITVTRKLQEMYSWIDSNKTGLWGRSYGGYSTAKILATDDSNVFKCGIAVAPVTSWLYYDAIYAERYMGQATADDNLDGYISSQVADDVNARKFKNKKFMLIHGTGDDNVHLQNSMALSKALINAGVLFEQFFYPDEYHFLQNVFVHFYRNLDKFFAECFGYEFD